jgi:hypothetical protein
MGVKPFLESFTIVIAAGIMCENQNHHLNSCVMFIMYIRNLQVWPQATREPGRHALNAIEQTHSCHFSKWNAYMFLDLRFLIIKLFQDEPQTAEFTFIKNTCPYYSTDEPQTAEFTFIKNNCPYYSTNSNYTQNYSFLVCKGTLMNDLSFLWRRPVFTSCFSFLYLCIISSRFHDNIT